MHMKRHVHHERSVTKLQTRCGASFVPQLLVPEADVKRVESDFRTGGLVQQKYQKKVYKVVTICGHNKVAKEVTKMRSPPKKIA